MPTLRLALALVLVTVLPALAADKPPLTESDRLQQWMTEHNLTRAIGFSAPSFWGLTTLYLDETQPHSATVQFYLHEDYYSDKGYPSTLRGTITHGPQIELLFTSKAYTLSKEIKGIPQGNARMVWEDTPSYYFTKIENGRTQSSSRNGGDMEYFEPIVRQQAAAAIQVINSIHEAKKRR